jgi:hypothetical protein
MFRIIIFPIDHSQETVTSVSLRSGCLLGSDLSFSVVGLWLGLALDPRAELVLLCVPTVNQLLNQRI